VDRLKIGINVTPNFIAMVNVHGNIKTDVYKYKIIESPVCSCKKGEHSVDHILFDCKLLQHESTKISGDTVRKLGSK
jgi:hypothetical protein